jgi:hypothetical protein
MNRRCRLSLLAALAVTIGLALGPGRPSQGAGLAAVPEHVQTSIQDLCYTDTCWHRSQRAVPLERVAAQVTWAFADQSIAADARRAGIHTIAYLDPSIQYDPKRDTSPLASDDESTYLRACDGGRARVRLGDLDGYFMNQGAPSFRARLAHYVDEHVRSQYDALFADDVFAATDTYAHVIAAPCHRAFDEERAATFGAWKAAGIPILFNGLGLAPDDGRVSDHAVAALDGPNTFGGMYELCFTAYDVHTDHTLGRRRVDSAWASVQNSHLAAVSRRKSFFCFAESPTDGATPDGLADRMYTYASFMLAFEPQYSVLQEHLRSAPSGVPVYPETRLVPLEPQASARQNITDLRRGGTYVREFAHCYVARVAAGPCAAVVNPSSTASAPWPLHGYRAALALHGGSIADGGAVAFTGPVPETLAPATAAIVIK